MTQTNFIHLHVHSAYSLAEGAIKVKDLVKLCRQGRMPAVAVTDSNNMFGAMEFALEAAENGIQPIIGAQVLVGERYSVRRARACSRTRRWWVLAVGFLRCRARR